MNNTLSCIKNEPYRLFFPIGIFCLITGALIWFPLLWSANSFPIIAHRALMLNGFSAFFIAGFLMTAVPKFSQTKNASLVEIFLFCIITVTGLSFAFFEKENIVYLCSAMQGLLIFFFLLSRIIKRKVNPPYSFIFIFIGIALWVISALMGMFVDSIAFKNLQYEGAIVAIILGVGSRLIPGILGHTEIVQIQRARYEREISYLQTVPLHFFTLILFFVGSYFLPEQFGSILRFIVFFTISIFYWKIYIFPKERTALTWCLWISCWLMLMSFLLKAVWPMGGIHASHAFFLSGIVLLTILIATRVLQSHGPKDKRTENYKILYLVTCLVVLAGATRVSAVFFSAYYEHHLGYSALVLTTAVFIWGYRYLRFIFI